MKLDQVIIKPLLSEKTTAETKFNRCFFRVNRLSNKNQIKEAIEKIFKVKVSKVRTINLKGKSKRSSNNRKIYRTSDSKKAIVELDGLPFKTFTANRDRWAIETSYIYPGPIQYYGPSEISEIKTITLELEHQ